MNGNAFEILKKKLKESLRAVLPVAIVVFLLCFTVSPVDNGFLMSFVLGTALLVVGMGFFTLGADIAMTPIGENVGSAITRSKKVWIVVTVSLLLGFIVTVSEPDLTVLASRIKDFDNFILILSVAAGVAVMLVIAVIRSFLRIRLKLMLLIFYGIVFVLAAFLPESFIAVSFDSGGVTTGPMTVPLIMALGSGAAAIRSDKNAESDSFGLIALCSVGPVIAIEILALIFGAKSADAAQIDLLIPENSRALASGYLKTFPQFFGSVALSLLPIIAFYGVFLLITRRQTKDSIIRTAIGLVYTYVGLVLFLTGAEVGFIPIGYFIGGYLGGLTYRWVLIPIGMIIGYFIVYAEPAVHVLNKQVYEITSGAIPKKAMGICLSVSVSVSVGLSMLRIITGTPILFILIPAYLIAFLLMIVSPDIFTSIAFDSGGVASGPMTSTFLLSLSIGAGNAAGISDVFGVVSMVAMTPLITIQILGVYYRIRIGKVKAAAKKKPTAETVIEI